MTTKKNPQDTTLRNVRAAKKRDVLQDDSIAVLVEIVKNLRDDVDEIAKRVTRLEQR